MEKALTKAERSKLWRGVVIAPLVISLLLGFGCGTVSLEVPEGYEVRLLEPQEPVIVRERRTVWFWLWGGRALTDNTSKSVIEEYNLHEVRMYTEQSMTDNILLIFTALVTIVRRTLVVEGNPAPETPRAGPTSAS